MNQKQLFTVALAALVLWWISRKPAEVWSEELPGYDPYNPAGEPIIWP